MAEWQWKRWDAVARLGAGTLTVREAATLLGLSVRHVRRVRRRLAVQERQGLAHGNRGRAPVNKLDAVTQERIVALRREKYRDFNDQHLTEKLAREVPAIVVSVASVRRLLRRAGIGAVWRRRPRQYRQRRDRKAQAGLMLLWDGSRHDWLEGRGPWLCLVGAIDDATGEVLPGAHFVEQECAAAYLQVLQAIATTCGLPWSIYMDQHGALKRNDTHWTLAEELRGTTPARRRPPMPSSNATGLSTTVASPSRHGIARRRGARCARAWISYASAASATRRRCSRTTPSASAAPSCSTSRPDRGAAAMRTLGSRSASSSTGVGGCTAPRS